MKKGLIAWIVLFVCNLMWSFQFTFIKLIQGQAGPYFTVWFPMLLATLLLIPFVARDFKRSRPRWRELMIFVQLALLGAFPAQVLMTWGTQYSLASNAAVLTLALPVVTAVFAFVLLKERMNRLRWLSFAVAILGVILCSSGDIHSMDFGSRYAWGNMLIFLAIAGNAYYNVGCKKIAGRYSETEMVFYTYVVLVALLTPLVLYYEPDSFSRIRSFTGTTWVSLASLTLFHDFLSMILFFGVLKYLDATQVALSNYLIAFMGLPIAAIFLHEQLSGQAITGGVLVLVSTLLLTVADRRQTETLLTHTPS